MAGKAKRRKAARERVEVAQAHAEFQRLAEAAKEKSTELELFKKALEVGEEVGLTPVEVARTLRTERRIATRAMRRTKRGAARA